MLQEVKLVAFHHTYVSTFQPSKLVFLILRITMCNIVILWNGERTLCDDKKLLLSSAGLSIKVSDANPSSITVRHDISILSLPCYAEEKSEEGKKIICSLGIRVTLTNKVDQPSIATQWYLCTTLFHDDSTSAYRQPCHGAISQTHCDSGTGAEYDMQVLQWRCFRIATHFCFPSLLQTIARSPASPQAAVVRVTRKAGCWNVVTSLSGKKGQY